MQKTPYVIGEKYVEACCRNEPDKVRSHLYKTVKYPDDDGREISSWYPMCGYGWNRDDGESYSILRGHRSNRGTCKTCLKNMEADKEPLKDGWKHKTRWC